MRPSGVDHGDHRRQQVERRVAGRVVGARRRRRAAVGGHSGGRGLAAACRSSRLMRGDVGFLARDRGLQLGHAVEVLLVVLLVALALGLAVVVFLLQRRQALLLASCSSSSRMRRASLSRARCAAGSTARRRRCPAAAATGACPAARGLGVWITVIGAPSSVLQPLPLGLLGGDRVRVDVARAAVGRALVGAPSAAPRPTAQASAAARRERIGTGSLMSSSPARSTRAERPRRQAGPDCHAVGASPRRPREGGRKREGTAKAVPAVRRRSLRARLTGE